jgi:DNA invertase Pin-like site-specific DNA recombinase
VTVAIGYLRVSTAEQAKHGYSLDAQRECIADEAVRRDWTVDYVEDAGYSAKSLNRPGLTHALDLLKRRQASVLVVCRYDRLTRDMGDWQDLLRLAKRQRWAIVALDFDIDTTTPMGEASANNIVNMAQLERRLIGDRTRVALANAKANGVRLGRLPMTSRDTEVRIVGLRESGLSLAKIADRLNAEAVPTATGKLGAKWTPTTVVRILTRLQKANAS